MKKTVDWIKENIKDIVQCQHCGTLNYYENIDCIDCEKIGPFLDKNWDREQEIEILTETFEGSEVLTI